MKSEYFPALKIEYFKLSGEIRHTRSLTGSIRENLSDFIGIFLGYKQNISLLQTEQGLIHVLLLILH